MRTNFLLCMLVGLATAVISCKPTFKIQSENILDRDFTRFNSYKFFNPASMPESNFAFSDTNKKRIFDAVAEEMNRRGFNSIQDADLIIKIQGGTSREIEDRRPTFYSPYDYGYYGYPYSHYRDPWMYDDISKKTTMLIVDILDAESKQLLWQGTGYGVLSEKPELVEANLRQAISDIFMQFPVNPQPGQ